MSQHPRKHDESSDPAARRLEDRLLMSATPLDLSISDGGTPADEFDPGIYAPLSASDGGDTEAPTSTLDSTEVIVSEDANNEVLNLAQYFSDNSDSILNYELVSVSNPTLFEGNGPTISGPVLTLDFADDAHGAAVLNVRAIDDAGNFVDELLHVDVLPINDRPTTTGFSDILVDDGSEATVIDLFASFDDIEDADSALSFSITQNTNPELFSSITIDSTAGLLTLEHAPGVSGISQITVRATDSEGAFVEMTTDGADFPIYDFFGGQVGTHVPDIPYSEMHLWFHGEIFQNVNGQLDFDNIDEDRIRGFARQIPEGVPLVVDIEHDLYDNSQAGRDRFAEVLTIIRDERPNLEIGLYNYMPRKSWYGPVNAFRAAEDSAREITNWFTNNAAQFNSDWQDIQANNDLFLTENVSAQYGGLTLPEYVDSTQPSLYTPFRNQGSATGHLTVQLETNVANDTFTTPSVPLLDGMRVGFKPSASAVLPGGVQAGEFYYVVEATNGSFKLSHEKGGDAIEISGSAAGNVYLQVYDARTLQHDSAVQYWDEYAAANIDEARQFGKDVIPWLSPSKQGVGIEYLEKNFFRQQLDLMFELADGIHLYDPSHSYATLQSNHGWWEALTEFVDYINSPTQFSIEVVATNQAPTPIQAPNFVLPAGWTNHSVDLNELFSDPNGDQLSYSILDVTAPQTFEALTVSNNHLNIEFADRLGISFVTVRASDGQGLQATNQFMVQIGDMAAPAASNESVVLPVEQPQEFEDNSRSMDRKFGESERASTSRIDSASEFEYRTTPFASSQALHWHVIPDDDDEDQREMTQVPLKPEDQD